MRLLRTLVVICVAGLLWNGSASALEFNPDTMMRVSELHEGMKGTCKTVLKGTVPEEFPVEIIGVLEKVWSGGDIILFRITAGPLVAKKMGILSGMSGSPIYIEGKLVGAISLSFDWGMMEPMGGATPIEQMIESMGMPESPQEARLVRPATAITVAGRPVEQLLLAPGGVKAAPTATMPVLRPVVTPLFVSGVRPDRLSSLSSLAERYGFRLYPGPGQMSNPVEAPLEAGSACGVLLCSGDVSVAFLGTVTYREGDEILAFGHPMMGTGPCELPLTAAYVHGFVESSFDPFKLSSPAQVVGALTGDYAFSVAGQVGQEPPMIPVAATISNLETGMRKRFEIQACKDKTLTPFGLMIALEEAAWGVGREMGASTWLSQVTVRAKGQKPITRRLADTTSAFGFFSYPGAYQLVDGVMDALYLLGSNPWETPEIEGVEIETQMVNEERSAEVMRVETERLTYRPGENVEVTAVIQPLNGKRYTERFSLPLPADLPDGPGTVYVSSGAYGPFGYYYGGFYGGGELLAPAIDNLPGLLEWYETLNAADELVAIIAYPTSGVTFPEGQLKDLPEHALNLLDLSGRQDQEMGMQWDKAVRHSEYVLWGGGYVEFYVQRERWGAPGEEPGAYAPASRSDAGPSPREEFEPAEESGGSPAMSRGGRPWGLGRPELGVQRPGGPSLVPSWGASGWTPVVSSWPPNLLRRQDGMPPEVRRELERRGLLDKIRETFEETYAAPEEEEEKVEEEEEEGPTEPVTRQALLHGWTTGEDFAAFRFSGAAPTPEGRITLLPAAMPSQVSELSEAIAWCAAARDDGTVFVGTGHKGRVYRIGAEGKAEVFFETGQLEVTSLALRADGTLYVGTGPEGRLYAVDEQGKGRMVSDFAERYVWDLLATGEGALMIATGGPAACVYRLEDEGPPREYLRPYNCRHALSLAAEGETVYVGTGEEGRVYVCAPDAPARIVYESKTHAGAADVVAILPTRVGVIAGTSDGEIRVIKPTGMVLDVPVPDEAEALSLGVLLPAGGEEPDGALALIGTTESDGALYVLFSLDYPPALVKRFPGHQFTAGARSPAGRAFLCTSNPSAVFALADAAGEQVGQALSPPYDMERVSRLGRIFWRAKVPEGADLRIESRAGNTSEPDESWGGWRGGYAYSRGEKIGGPPARYVQFRVNMRSSPEGEAPSLDELYFIYMTANQAPEVSFSEPMMIAFWSGEKEVSWDGDDPDGDTLVYDLFISSDNGLTWEPLEKNLEDTTYTWNTEDYDDGVYRLKVVASDARANAGDAQRYEALSCAVFVDNTAPVLSKWQVKHELDGDNRLHVWGSAIDRQSDIAAVEYTIDDGKAISARAEDGIFDSSYERFSFVTEPLEPGKHSVKITAYDEPRTTTSATVEVEVAAPEEAGAGEQEPGAEPEDGVVPEEGEG